MKSLTVRLPDELIAQLEAESRKRKISKSDIVRERLAFAARMSPRPAAIDAIADLVGSVHGLPPDLSTRKKEYLKAIFHGRKRHR
jgi:Ribbon-helix-helix protein, copG family